MKADLLEVAMIVDKSGSMLGLQSDTIGGFNSFLEDQRKLPGYANVTTTFFNHDVDIVDRSIPIAEIKPIDTFIYRPGGNTALLDAIGMTINDLGSRLAALPETERASKVMVVIITDGHENSSKEFTHAQVSDMINHQTDVYQWEFIFLGATIDTPAIATAMNIPASNSIVYANTSIGVAEAYNGINERTTSNRIQ